MLVAPSVFIDDPTQKLIYCSNIDPNLLMDVETVVGIGNLPSQPKSLNPEIWPSILKYGWTKRLEKLPCCHQLFC